MNSIIQDIIKKKRILSRILVVLMVFLQLPNVRNTVEAAGMPSGIDLDSTTGWTRVYPANGQNDPQGDQQTGGSSNSVSQDIVGDSTNPSTYIKFSTDKTELAIRIRVNNCDGNSANPEFKNFTFVGVDANGNGTVDFFLGVYNPTGSNGRLGIYSADTSALNAGPSTTGISGKPLMSFAPVKDVNYSIIQADSNIFEDPDYFVTYKFKVADISSAIVNKTKENVTFTADTAFRFITGTAAQDNAFNQDISGMNKGGWGSGKTWLELNVFSPVISVNGGTYYAVTFDKNTGDTDASPAAKIVQSGSSIGALPLTNPTKRGMYFQEWNTSPDGTGEAVAASTTINGDKTVYAIWGSKPVYTVTFQGNGGGWTDGSTAKTISTINGVIGDNMPVNPVKAGSYFIGWGTDTTLNKSIIYDSQTSISGNTTLYALWDNNVAYTATFYDNIGANGGQVIASLYPNPSGQIQSNSLPSPTRSGYTFSGWYDNMNYTGAAFTGGAKINNNMSYYAKWTPATYTLTYNGNGGTLSGPTTTSITNGKFVVPDLPTRTGYIFLEWNVRADGTGEPMYQSSDITANTTVYAIWQPIVTVTFDANGGTFDVGAPTTINVKNKKLTELPIPPSKSGFTFLGWSTSLASTSLVSLTSDFNSSATLYAVWSPVYTVTFNANSGAWSENILQIDVLTAYGNVLYNPEEPIKEGYVFDSWNTKTDGSGTRFSTSTEVTGNVIVYAIWRSTVTTKAVTFNSQGGSAVGSQSVNYGEKALEPNAPTRTGYSFGGWYKEENYTNPWIFSADTVTENITLYAKWNVNNYIVTFNSQSGSAVGNQSINYGEKALEPSTPTRTGYSFGGWYKESSCTNLWNFSTNSVTENTTLYAKWNINSYTVTFNSQSGSAVGSQSVNYGEKALEPSTPTRTGYSFGGWYKESSCTNLWNFSTNSVTENITLYAKWNVNNYIVTFNSQGGSAVGSQDTSHGEKVTEPSTPIKAGYSFGGWYKEANCINLWDFGTNSVTANTTLYAKWNINSYNVTFNSLGGSTVAGQSISHGEKAAEPSTPSRAGYSFGGWYKGENYTNSWDFSLDSVTENTTLYAKWNINSYTVTFNSQGGSAVGSQSINHGEKAAEPSTPSRAGYSFGGWYKGENYTNSWDFSLDSVTENTTLYAKWNINSYTVTFNSQGGSAVGSQSINHGEKALETSTPTRTGYSFGGWYKESSCTNLWNFSTNSVTENTTLYAKWNVNNYIVTFNSQSGSAVENQSINYGEKALEPSAPTRTGYSFGGWYKESSCTNLWNFSTNSVTENITLYAKWNVNNYIVTFNSQGGSAVGSQDTSHGEKAVEPSTPTKTGYNFGGWYKEANYTNSWDFSLDAVTANTTLYAKWNINSYNVTFNSQIGSAVGSQSINHGEKALEPSAPTRTGYSFGGWYKDVNHTNTWNFNFDTVTANTTLYAKWNADSYTVSGTVKDDSSGEESVSEVKVYVERAGNKISGPVYTDKNGKFTLYGVPRGVYNLVIEYTDVNGNTTIITQIINVNGDTQVGNVKLPLGRKNSIYVPKAEVSVNAVGKLNEVFDNVDNNIQDDLGVTVGDLNIVEKGGEVIIRLESDSVNENKQATQISDVKTAINRDNKYLGYMVDLSVYKDVMPLNGQTKTSKLRELNNLVDIYISLPKEIQGKTGYAIYRYHDGIVNTITETPNERGEKITVDGNTIILTIQKFSVYAISYDVQNDIVTEVLPKTGSTFDFTTLIITGLLSSFAGVMIMRRKKRI